MFGGRKEQNEQFQAVVDRLSALPLAELAVEVMTKGFGPGGPAGDGGYAALSSIAGALNPVQGSSIDSSLLIEHFKIVAEGAQLLEHAGLVRFEVFEQRGNRALELDRHAGGSDGARPEHRRGRAPRASRALTELALRANLAPRRSTR